MRSIWQATATEKYNKRKFICTSCFCGRKGHVRFAEIYLSNLSCIFSNIKDQYN